MSRLKKYSSVPSLFGAEPQSRELRKESRWSDMPWQPGEIPMRNGSLMPVYGPLDQKPMPYGEFLGVQKPCECSGQGYSPIKKVDSEGRETKVKQK